MLTYNSSTLSIRTKEECDPARAVPRTLLGQTKDKNQGGI